MRNRWRIPLMVFLCGMLLAGCGASREAQPTAAVTALPEAQSPRSLRGGGVTASGEVIPAREAQLSFTLPGRVQMVSIRVDDSVPDGAVLVTLDTANLDAQVAQAEAAVDVAQANLDRLLAGARPEEIASAKEAVALAEAQIAQAKAALEAAEAQHAAAQSAVDAARAALHAAQAGYRQLESGASEAERAAVEAELKLAEAHLHQAQSAYDRVKNSPDVQMSPEALALEQATIACEAARTQYEAIQRGATSEERDAALAQVESAQVAVAQAENQALAALAQARQAASAVEAAKAQEVQAGHQVSLLEAGAPAGEIAAAQAQVAQAEAALQAARVSLSEAVLRAPFDGTVIAAEIEPGETVLPAQVVVRIADLSHLQVETTDLSERDVANVQPGQPVTIYLEALAAEISGQVSSIASQASTAGGDVVYTVSIGLAERPPGLRWGMSVEVDIEAD